MYSEILFGLYQGKGYSSTQGRPTDKRKCVGFEQLTQYLEESDEHQYSSFEIFKIYENFCSDEEIYLQKWLDQKLIYHYGDDIIITILQGNSTVYSLDDHGPLARYVKNVGCACPGNAGNVFPATAGWRFRHASRHVRDLRAVMQAGSAN